MLELDDFNQYFTFFYLSTFVLQNRVEHDPFWSTRYEFFNH